MSYVPLLREADAAHALGLSPRTLEWHRRHGSGLAFYRLGDHSLAYAFDDLAQWLAARRVGPPRPAGSPDPLDDRPLASVLAKLL